MSGSDIQDDNFGPYYFFPFHRLSKIINCAIIPLPTSSIRCRPHEAANIAVRETIYDKGFRKFLNVELEKNPLPEVNKRWFEEFEKHLYPTWGDGLVPRTILRTGEQIMSDYSAHEFSYVVTALLNNDSCRGNYYWAVELSWPSIYCFGQSRSGMILVDTSTAEINFFHIPGVCIALVKSEDKIEPFVFIAKEEDSPFPHHKPGVVAERK